jgi:uncharacterized protein (TIGR03000 family)
MSRRFLLCSTAILAVTLMTLGATAPAQAQTVLFGAGVQPALAYGYAYVNNPGYLRGHHHSRAHDWGYSYLYNNYLYPYTNLYLSNPTVACPTNYYPAAGSYSSSICIQDNALAPAAPVCLAPELPLTDNSAHVRVIVPPDANVWFNGMPTQQCGVERAFVSPPLNPGQDYTYDIAAQWINNGQPVAERRTIHVHANEYAVLDLTGPPPVAAVALARPAPAPAPAQ